MEIMNFLYKIFVVFCYVLVLLPDYILILHYIIITIWI